MSRLCLLPLPPLLSSLALLFLDCRGARSGVSFVGVGGALLSFACTALIGSGLIPAHQLDILAVVSQQEHIRHVFSAEPRIRWTSQLDQLSLAAGLMISGVGSLVQLYAVWYMRDDENRASFLAYTNLSVSSALLLITADNLLLMFLGWEIIGFCSYLLIDFRPDCAGDHSAGLRSFVVTRMSDVFLMIAMFMMSDRSEVLSFRELFSHPADLSRYPIDLVNLMLLLGTLGKSAQFPVHFWLPAAMTAPAPASALVHAVIGVTSGIYLIVRMRPLLLLSPRILRLAAWIGALTLLLSGLAALSERNMKKILAYSTAGQVGCMLLAAGTKVWSGAVMYMMAHSFCKSLLFLITGSVSQICGEQDIFKARGLNVGAHLIIFLCHLVGSASLAALPLTAAFACKRRMFSGVLHGDDAVLLAIALIGTLLTPVYVLRMSSLLFRGGLDCRSLTPLGGSHSLPLVTLSILSTYAGYLLIDSSAAALSLLDDKSGGGMSTTVFHAVELLGSILAAYLYLGGTTGRRARNRAAVESCLLRYLRLPGLERLCWSIFIRPYLCVSRLLRPDPARLMIESGVPLLVRRLSPPRRGENQSRWDDDLVLVGLTCAVMLLLVGNLRGGFRPVRR